MCERQIEGNGGDVDPSIVVTGDGTLVVLSLTNGGVLVSRDDGCSFARALGPLQGHRGIDLTLDPSDPSHVLALTSTIIDVNEDGRPRFNNLLAHSLDNGQSWQVLAKLPDDLSAETVEVAPSDAKRIYVSGTSSVDPLQGIILRSDDGGRSWTRSTVRLPRGSGSLYLSGIHPSDPDRLWFRVPGRGDIYGVLPARLWLTTDAAQTFTPIAETAYGMLGFAVSPTGDRIAFGGPLDGLYLASADASEPPVKVSQLRVSCLRWHASGLHVCAGEPVDPYSVGVAVEPLQGFVPLWHRADTCRAACAAPSSLELNCQEPWQMIAPLTGAESAVCEPGASVVDAGDAGIDAVPMVDAETDASPPAPAASGCSVVFASSRHAPGWRLLWLSLVVGLRSCRRRWPVLESLSLLRARSPCASRIKGRSRS